MLPTEKITLSILEIMYINNQYIYIIYNRVLRSEENVKEKDGQHMKENGVPLVVTYNPNFKNLSFLIRKNYCKKFDLNITELDKTLLIIYWLPKIHKTLILMDTSSSIRHRFDVEISRGKFVEISSRFH